MFLIRHRRLDLSSFFFFNDTATTEIYTLSLHDALPISDAHRRALHRAGRLAAGTLEEDRPRLGRWRSEEHTSELQSQSNLVCRLLLEKKKKKKRDIHTRHALTDLTTYTSSVHPLSDYSM